MLKESVKINLLWTNIFGEKLNFLQNQKIGFIIRFINNPDGNPLET